MYIADWKRTSDRGNWAACWQMGYDMPDVPRPKPMSSTEYSRRWRAKQDKYRTVTQTEKGLTHVIK